MVDKPEAPGVLYGWAMIWTLLGIFAGGMALNLTPCVYPLIPITISYFGGKSDRRQLIGHGLCYIGGLAVTNSILVSPRMIGSACAKTSVIITRPSLYKPKFYFFACCSSNFTLLRTIVMIVLGPLMPLSL